MFKKIRNYIIPIKSNNTLSTYQKTIVFGEWIVVSFIVLSVILNANNGNNRMLELLKQYLIGIVCSMVVVIITSVLQFNRIKEELFREFYYNIFSIIGFFKESLNDQNLVEKDYIIKKKSNIEKSIDKFYEKGFDIVWFSKEKEKAYLLVIKNIFKISSIFENVFRDENNIADINKKTLESTIDNMIILSEKSYPEEINVFKMLKKQ